MLTTSPNVPDPAHDVEASASVVAPSAGELVESGPGPVPTYEALAAELIALKDELATARRRLRAAQDAYLTLEWNWEDVWT